MTQQPDMSEMDEYYEQTRKPLFNIPTSPIGKAIFALLLVLWFALLMLPCGMLWLAVGNTITISRNNIPEPELHPRLEIQLIMDTDNRGLKFSSTGVNQADDLTLCVQNNISYFLWENDESAEPASYCQCYQREDTESEWEFIEQLETACTP